MDEASPLLPSVFATLLSIALAVLVTIVALGPRSLEEARLGWRALFPRTRAEAEAEILLARVSFSHGERDGS